MKKTYKVTFHNGQISILNLSYEERRLLLHNQENRVVSCLPTETPISLMLVKQNQFGHFTRIRKEA